MMPELLAPAGGPGPFMAALAAGADAIYCGLGNDLNARRGAHNFDDESFSAACRAAHLAGARVYVTVNVVVRGDELEAALALVRRAATLGADAFIIQDWGLLAAVRATWSELECHVSTQANVHDARGVAWCRDTFGVRRVTLSRELSLKEVGTISREGVELEVFGHGALCYCYSGVCLLSSMAGGRSANRGLCAQPCRLPYDLVDERGEVVAAPGRTRPLCPKDACTIDDLADMAASGVGSLKVEGRMKAPDYVYSVISTYRATLDELACGRVPSAVERDERARTLKRSFNRDFTDAYLHGRSGDELMSYARSNNRGQLVGEVLESGVVPRGFVRPKDRQARPDATARIRLSQPVGEGDLLELREDADPDAFLTCKAPKDAAAGEVLQVIVARPMPRGCPVRAIRSAGALAAADAALKQEVPRRRPVRVRIVARLGQPFGVEVTALPGRRDAGPVTSSAEGLVVEAARTRAVTREDLVEHVGRMGSTPFEAVGFEVEMDEGCGMSFSAVHKVRAQACDALEEALLAPYEARAKALAAVPEALGGVVVSVEGGRPTGATAGPDTFDAVEVCALVTTPAAVEATASAGATRIYVPVDELAEGVWPDGCIPLLDEVCREPDHARLDRWVRPGLACAAGNVSELSLAHERGALCEVRGCIPVHNAVCLATLEGAGATGVWLSPELTLAEIACLAPHAAVPVGLVVSGRPRVMTSEHCVFQAADACIHDCAHCALRSRRLSLRGRDGRLLPVRGDLEGRSRIYDAYPLDVTPQVGELVSAGVSRLAVDATLLDEREAASAVERLVRALAAARQGRHPAPRAQGATSGHLFMGIG